MVAAFAGLITALITLCCLILGFAPIMNDNRCVTDLYHMLDVCANYRWVVSSTWVCVPGKVIVLEPGTMADIKSMVADV